MSNFQNSKLWVQYGGKKFKKLLDFCKTWYPGVFRVADYESDHRFLKFQMADQIWRSQYFQNEKYYIKFGIWRVSVSLIIIRFSKFKMVNLISWNIRNNLKIFADMLFVYWTFFNDKQGFVLINIEISAMSMANVSNMTSQQIKLDTRQRILNMYRYAWRV